MYYVYILRCNNNSLYTGITNDLDGRMKKHKLGKGSKYVRAHLPFVIVYLESFETKSDALRREVSIKKMKRKEKLLLLNLC